jgi:hypothetical protein
MARFCCAHQKSSFLPSLATNLAHVHGEILLRSPESELSAFAGNEPCPFLNLAAKVRIKMKNKERWMKKYGFFNLFLYASDENVREND